MEKSFTVLLLALLLDRLIGDLDFLWRYIPHPISFFGKIINLGESIGNNASFSLRKRSLNGWMSIVLLLLLSAGSGLLFTKVFLQWGIIGFFTEVFVVSLFLAQKSLSDHVIAVHRALERNGLEQGRQVVSAIVGRDTCSLDRSGICRAAIESLAENSSDGVIAPAFWFLLLGIPGLLAYKMLNTADSMIGYKNTYYAAFGFATARLDDIANYIPARLTGFLTILAVFFLNGRNAALRTWQVMWHDAKYHCSVNAGWPECAFAGAINIRLGGPRYYSSNKIDEPFQNIGGREADCADILEAIHLFWLMMTLSTVGIAFAAIIGCIFI